MIEGIDIEQRIDFVLDNDTEPKTVFVFRPISGSDKLNIQSKARGMSEGDCIIELLNTCIVEIKGIDNKYKFLRSLDINVLSELVEKHNSISEIKDDDKKN